MAEGGGRRSERGRSFGCSGRWGGAEIGERRGTVMRVGVRKGWGSSGDKACHKAWDMAAYLVSPLLKKRGHAVKIAGVSADAGAQKSAAGATSAVKFARVDSCPQEAVLLNNAAEGCSGTQPRRPTARLERSDQTRPLGAAGPGRLTSGAVEGRLAARAGRFWFRSGSSTALCRGSSLGLLSSDWSHEPTPGGAQLAGGAARPAQRP